MKIAFCVEGSADRAILYGLRDRWCRDAELMEGRFRGQLPRSQIPKECKILSAKGADLIIFLRDANLENWREVVRADVAKCPSEFRHIAVFGVCDRNAECWLAAAPEHLANRIGRPLHELQSQDPSPFVKAGFGMVGFDATEKEAGIASYVANAPIGRWLSNDSFQNFYDQLCKRAKNEVAKSKTCVSHSGPQHHERRPPTHRGSKVIGMAEIWPGVGGVQLEKRSNGRWGHGWKGWDWSRSVIWPRKQVRHFRRCKIGGGRRREGWDIHSVVIRS